MDRNSHPIEGGVIGQPIMIEEKILYLIGNSHGPYPSKVFCDGGLLGFRVDVFICTTTGKKSIGLYTPLG